MSITPAISANNLCFSYAEHCALHEVSFSVLPGEFVAFTGPNGGGKTTLLRLLIGSLVPTQGSLELFGMSPHSATKAGLIGYVPQRIVQTSVGFPATVGEVIESNGGDALVNVLDAMKALRIDHLLERSLASLSGGERQKVFIARALSRKPKLLLLDEPTTGIDQAAEEEFFGVLRMLHKEGMTIAIVSHDADAVANEAQKVYCIDQTMTACDVHPSDPHHRHVHHSHASHAI